MTIYELGLEDFTKIVVAKLEEDNNEIVLENPQTDSTYPCGVVRTPIKLVDMTENGIPVRSRFAITVDWWTDKKYDSMALADKADRKLRELNLIRTGAPIDTYDDITKKYRNGGNYEVFFNGLTNSFDLTK